MCVIISICARPSMPATGGLFEPRRESDSKQLDRGEGRAGDSLLLRRHDPKIPVVGAYTDAYRRQCHRETSNRALCGLRIS